MNIVKKKTRLALVVIVCGALIFLAASQFVSSFSTLQSDCSESGCHTSSSSITIGLSATTFDIEPGDTFQLDVQVDSTAGTVELVVKFPTDLRNNDDFTYVGLDADGLIRDGDGNDLDLDDDQIQYQYTIQSPAIANTYTLEIFAAGNTPHGDSELITVNAIPIGPGPLITNVNGTPGIPLADEEVIVTANVTSTAVLSEVTLQYSIDDRANWNNVTMTLSGNLYEGTLPGFTDDTVVIYRVVAVDENGIESISGELTYTVGDIPEPPPEPIPQLHYGWYLGAPALFFAYLGTALEYYDEERFTRIHGYMLSIAYFLTLINVVWLVNTGPGAWTALNPAYLIDTSNMLLFMHSWHIWLGFVSMIFGTLAMITHLAGWKTCNLGLPAVLLWTILGIMGIYLGETFRM